ncbi:MAG: ATP-binding protein, partial [Gemmatimonadaceae bacterium]
PFRLAPGPRDFRVRLTLAFSAIALVPLVVFGYGVHREMTSRLDADSARRVAAVTTAVNADLSQSIATDQARLHSLATDLAADNRFRLAIANPASSERQWLLDWAAASTQLGGFAMLQLQDSAGRILSSGQFRNDFDRLDPALPADLATSPGGAILVSVRTPGGSVRALASLDTFTVSGRVFSLVGGRSFDSTRVARLSPDREISVALQLGDAPQLGDVVGDIALPYFDDQGTSTAGTAHLILRQDLGPSRALKQGVNRWLVITLGSTLIVAVLVAALLAGRVSRPLAELASKTARLDLDKLDQRFATDRQDEIGTLSRTLDAMRMRLRTGAARLRETERLAATGDLARQVNHDIKNGLAPIRNVLRHLSQTAEREPDRLPSIYLERRGTLESSVDYLDELARNYARISPVLDRTASDPRQVLLDVAQSVTGAPVEVRVPESLPRIRADTVVLRRILDNLISNAIDALDGQRGSISLTAEPVGQSTERRVRIIVSDTGRGMTRQQLDRAFDDFYTTKSTGTGLGLSVVRRLLTDLGGSIRVETAPGEGSTFTIEIPAA